MASTWKSIGLSVWGDSLTLVTVDVAQVTEPRDLLSALEVGIDDLTALVVEVSHRRKQPIGIDVRVPAEDPLGATSTILSAVRGLTQAYTLESGAAVGAVNIVVSRAGQRDDREKTWAYLASESSGMARGATIDLSGIGR